jgi:hypothetical protein
MTRELIVTTILLLGAGCSDHSVSKSSNDAGISNRIVGVWKVDEITPKWLTARGLDSFSKDGTFTSKGTLSRGNLHVGLAFSGTWQIGQGVLVQTITNSSNTNLHIGLVTRTTIVSVDDRHCVFRNDDGKVISRDRLQ